MRVRTNINDSLDTQVDVLLDAETKVAVGGEILLPQLVLLDLEATLKDLLSLGSPAPTEIPSDLRFNNKFASFYQKSNTIIC